MEKGFIALIGLMFCVSMGIVTGVIPSLGQQSPTPLKVPLEIKRGE